MIKFFKKAKIIFKQLFLLEIVDGLILTLKYFFKKEGKVYLEAANQAYEPIIIDFGEVVIQGKLVAVWRKA